MRRVAPPLCAAGLLAIGMASARADQVSGVRGAELAIERVALDVRFSDGMVHATVAYDLVNRSRGPDQATVDLSLPAGAVVTGLRYRMGERWLTGKLMAADAASARFDAYLDDPFVAARGAAMISHDGYRGQLQMSYVPPRGRVAIAYDLALPACFSQARWLAMLPLDEPGAAIHVGGGRVEEVATLERALGQPIADACARFAVSDLVSFDGGDRLLVFDRPQPTGAAATMTTVDTRGTVVSELQVVTGAALAAAPRAAVVVFAVDASRSVGAAGVAAQLDIIRGYLAQVPDARFDIVVYRRRAVRLFGELIPARDAAARLAAVPAAALAPGNGSDLDVGLALAADVLARAGGPLRPRPARESARDARTDDAPLRPRPARESARDARTDDAPLRLVAFTDDRTRGDLDDATLLGALSALPSDAIVHLAIPDRGADSSVLRDFDHRFAAVAARWGGIVADVRVGGDVAPLTELVRPLWIERITWDTPAGEHEELEPIGGGGGLRKLYAGAGVPAVQGWIWGRRWQPTPTSSRAASARVARVALGAIATELDDRTIAVLAGLGTAATRLTSFLADDPSWRPGGLPDDELGMTSGFSSSSACGWPYNLTGTTGSIGHGFGTGTGIAEAPPELEPLLAGRVAACAGALGGADWSTAVGVEATGDEIVDVGLTTEAPAATADQRARFDACVVEAAWDLELDARFQRYWQRTWTATFTR